MTLSEFKKLLESAPDDTDMLSLLPKLEPEKVFVNTEIITELPIQEGCNPLFRHSVNPGDLIAAMGCFKTYWEITERKVIVSQNIGKLAAYYHGAIHPTVDANGNFVTCNDYMFDMLKPLIESQPYISSFQKYEGQKIDIDLDVIRGKTFVNLPHGTIQGWIPIAYPDLSFDISKAWIVLNGKCPNYVKKQVKRKIVLNFTERYREANLEYFFLKNYAPDLIFAGTEREHFDFCNRWQLTCPRLEIDNFLDLAYAIRESRFVLANQSMIWNLCQAMGVRRVLEMCRFADNCFPMIGENSLGGFYQAAIEYSFRRFYNETN